VFQALLGYYSSMTNTQTYTQWKSKVNYLVLCSLGLGVDDQPDFPYLDWYENGVGPFVAAKRTIRAIQLGDYDNYDH
jgi:hypothetical protein